MQHIRLSLRYDYNNQAANKVHGPTYNLHTHLHTIQSIISTHFPLANALTLFVRSTKRNC